MTLQISPSAHCLVAPTTQVPPWQVSPPAEQRLPLVQAVPSFAAGFEHWPVAGSQVPATWHWSWAVQVIGVWTQVWVPRSQRSVVQALPSSHWLSLVQHPWIGAS